MCAFASLTPLLQSQQEKIDSIEDNINTASTNVEEGTKSLGKVCIFECVCVCVCADDPMRVRGVFGRWGDRWHFASQPFHSVCPYWSAQIRRKAAIKEIERREGWRREAEGRESDRGWIRGLKRGGLHVCVCVVQLLRRGLNDCVIVFFWGFCC